MTISDKTNTMLGHAVPIVQASILNDSTEPCGVIRTECVVIDEYLECNGDAEPSFECSESPNVISMSVVQSTNPLDWSADHAAYYQSYQSGYFPPEDITYSQVDQSKTCGAWAAGMILGFILGAGPSLSIVFGIGAAYCSQKEEGVAGDIARALSEVAILSHKKFVEVDKKHNLIDTFSSNASNLSRNCFFLMSRASSTIFSMVCNKKNRNETRQMNTSDTEVT